MDSIPEARDTYIVLCARRDNGRIVAFHIIGTLDSKVLEVTRADVLKAIHTSDFYTSYFDEQGDRKLGAEIHHPRQVIGLEYLRTDATGITEDDLAQLPECGPEPPRDGHALVAALKWHRCARCVSPEHHTPAVR